MHVSDSISRSNEPGREPSIAANGPSKKLRATLIGIETHHIASVCHAVSSDILHIEPIGDLRNLSPGDCDCSDAILVWNGCQSIESVCTRLMEIRRCLPVIAIAKDPSPSEIVEAMRAGAADFLAWPCRPIDLMASIVRAQACNEGRSVAHGHMLEARARLARLSKRQTQVLSAMAQGMSNKQIARDLRISDRTVEIHRSLMLDKLGATTSADAIRWLIEATLPNGWVRERDSWFAPWSPEALFRADKRLASRPALTTSP
jgi:two-component system, LuxR family, response regulator FixJ